MAWTTPASYSVGEVVTASKLNLHIRDNLRYLKGLDGQIDFENVVTCTSNAANGSIRAIKTGGSNNTFSLVSTYELVSTASSIADGHGPVFRFDGSWTGGTPGSQQFGLFGMIRNGAAGADFIWRNNSPSVETMRLTTAGHLGLGTAAPQQRFHAVQSRGAMLFYGASSTFATATVIIPAAAANVPSANSRLFGSRAILTSATTRDSGTFTVFATGADVTADLFNDGAGNQLVIRLRSTGQVEIERLAGSLTYQVAIHFLYITAS